MCKEVHYYRRQTLPHKLLSKEPYIVSSRQSTALLEALQRDNEPVLLEGLHCCWLLPLLRTQNADRILFVRAHNVEHHYYRHLASSERCWAKRLYLRSDARKLERYEIVLKQASAILAVTQSDTDYFKEKRYAPVYLIPSSHGQTLVSAPCGKGSYVLFQGDLSVADNQRTVLFLLNEVLAGDSHAFVVAGRRPSQELRQQVSRHPNATLVANPNDEEMQRLLQLSHVCILYTNQATGLKLKLLHALYSGRFCLVNSKMVAGTPLGKLCTVADTPQAMRHALKALFEKDFTESDRLARESILHEAYSDSIGARKLINLLERQY